MAAEVEGARAVSLVCRIAAVALSVAAAVVMGTASQWAVVDVTGGVSSSSYVVSYSRYTALVYFVVAGAISAVCSAAALYASAVHRKPHGALVAVLDAVAQGLLFSAAGAAFAVRSVVGDGGSSASGSSVCAVAGAFCGRVSTAAAAGAFAAFAVAVAALARDARGSLRGCCNDL